MSTKKRIKEALDRRKVKETEDVKPKLLSVLEDEAQLCDVLINDDYVSFNSLLLGRKSKVVLFKVESDQFFNGLGVSIESNINLDTWSERVLDRQNKRNIFSGETTQWDSEVRMELGKEALGELLYGWVALRVRRGQGYLPQYGAELNRAEDSTSTATSMLKVLDTL